ncbi:MAG: hypothetical protein ACRD6X_01115 [Pyrinomonadaceae bacterium]
MYCSGCGSQIQSGLNYCSRCGRRVAEEQRHGTYSSPEIAATTGGAGFVCYIFVILVMTKAGISPSAIVPITFFYFSALFGLCFMLLRSGSESVKKAMTRDEIDTSESAYLRPALNTAQLGEASENPASVTDHTTRTLEKVPVSKI